MRTVRLADVAAINPRNEPVSADTPVSFVGMAELDGVSATAKPLRTRTFAEVSKGYTVFRDRDVLAAKITPCWENGKVGQACLDHPIGVGSTEFHILRPSNALHDRYLIHFLRQSSIRVAGELCMTGSGGQRRVPAAFLRELNIPLPQLDEQRRISDILDKIDAIRARRRQVLAYLDSLIQSVFHDMFGGVEFPRHEFGSLVEFMRNGMSPSMRGTVSGTVLTLSAVTQGTFDAVAAKPAMFDIEPSEKVRVDARDFLICRGNGNKSLVGVGVYSPISRPDLVFPDTVIGARVDADRVDLNYLQSVWREAVVRRQIEAGARTTNGTYKVNQKTLGSVLIPLPPMVLQRKFADRAQRINAQKELVQRALVMDDELFASLQERAFKGEL